MGMLILILLGFVIGCVIGWLIGGWNDVTNGMTFCDGVKEFMEGPVSKEPFPKIDREKMHIWDIVRYKDNGEYDCVWSSGYTKRDADKK